MAERDIDACVFFKFATSKADHLCRVKHCRNDKSRERTICHKCKMRLWRYRNPTRSAYHALRSKAAVRKIKFTLTFIEFTELCQATSYLQEKGNHADQLHIDRIDPNKGYELSNIQVLTCSENSRKGSYERWITLKSGRRVRLCDIGVGVYEQPADTHEEEEAPRWLVSRDPDNEPF